MPRFRPGRALLEEFGEGEGERDGVDDVEEDGRMEELEGLEGTGIDVENGPEGVVVMGRILTRVGSPVAVVVVGVARIGSV